MCNSYTAVNQQDGDWWIGGIEEVPGVNCQEATRQELLESLRIALREAMELDQHDIGYEDDSDESRMGRR